MRRIKDLTLLEVGQSTIYHVGFLACDREKNDKVHLIATQAWFGASEGRFELTQRRLAPFNYQYIARRIA